MYRERNFVILSIAPEVYPTDTQACQLLDERLFVG